MTFRQMELFMAVCEHKSITQAAASYYVSQQGISKMIRDLETELGCKLLNRTKSGVTPTNYGIYLLGECRSILDKKNYICSNISQMKKFSHEVIFLGMAFGMISAIPYKLIIDFEKMHPYISVDYSDHTDFYLESLMKKDEYDFCITTGVLDADNFTSEKLLQEPIYLYIPRNHELCTRETIKMEDLKHQKFAMFSTQFHIRHNFVASCRNAGFDPIIEVTSNDFNSLKEIAKYNNLLCVVPKHTINTDSSGLRYYPFPDASFHWDAYFIKKKNKVLSENIVAFYQHIKQSIKDYS